MGRQRHTSKGRTARRPHAGIDSADSDGAGRGSDERREAVGLDRLGHARRDAQPPEIGERDDGLHGSTEACRDAGGSARADTVLRAAVGRLSVGRAAFDLLNGLANRRERIAYADFAFELRLGSPRNLGWLLSPLLGWCRASDLPWLPIIVVRRADGLPSGGYDVGAIESETERVFAHRWAAVAGPSGAELLPFAARRSTEAGHPGC